MSIESNSVRSGDLAARGIECGEVKLNLDNLMKKKKDAVTALTGGIKFLFKGNKVTHLEGYGKITGPNEVSVLNPDGSVKEVCYKKIYFSSMFPNDDSLLLKTP